MIPLQMQQGLFLVPNDFLEEYFGNLDGHDEEWHYVGTSGAIDPFQPRKLVVAEWQSQMLVVHE